MRAALVIATTLALVGAAPPPPSLQTSIRERVRYVFVIYQENRSFDHYFGTFPGANGIYSAEAQAHGFRQFNPVAKRETQAFRVATPDLGLLNNARPLMDAAVHGGAMDGFVAAEAQWAQSMPAESRAALGMHDLAEAAAVGDEAMAHVDCDTIPYLWAYASRFSLFDSFFQGVRAPSAPSNVEIIAAQNGETEFKRYGAVGPKYTRDPEGASGRGVPMFVDLDPAWGPYNTVDFSKHRQVDQTYATVLLNLEGAESGKLTQYAQDVADDIAFYERRVRPPSRGRGTSRASPTRPIPDA